MVQCQTFSNDINDDEDDKRNKNINKDDDGDDTLDKKAVESIIYKTGTCLMQCHYSSI